VTLVGETSSLVELASMFSNLNLTVEIDLGRLVSRLRSRRSRRDEALEAVVRLEGGPGGFGSS